MESVSDRPLIQPPWKSSQFFSEDGLRAAQEYYFQTHATHSRLIAEGRQAQGMSKSLVRRKLTREMGEDFKLYTGTEIGQASGDKMDSLGIRGEMNELLKHIYLHIAPGQPITSPTQEDLTILRHPQGGIAVCYAMVFFYGSLLRKYASLAGNRRKVLKSILDEELFKWIWRTVIAFMMAPAEGKVPAEDAPLCAGLSFIPSEQQRVPLGQKLYEIGMFLLGKSLQESHLRLPLCHYYVVLLRQFQTYLMTHLPAGETESVYPMVTRRVEGEPMENPLVGIDALLNAKGASMDSFDDVLKDATQLLNYIPALEFEFINQFEDFGNPKRLASTIRRLVPDPRREAINKTESSLTPLLLMLRTMPVNIREAVLGALPVPILNLLRSRIGNAPQDDVARELAVRVRDAMEARKKDGESYTVHSRTSPDKAAVAASVRVAPPRAGRDTTAPPPPRTTMPPAPIPPPRPAAPPEPAPRAEPPGGAASSRPAPAAEREQAPAAAGGLMVEPAILAWRVDNARIVTVSLSAGQLMQLTGPELRYLVPWVMFALKTGQVFGLRPEQVTKEAVEQIVTGLRTQGARLGGASLPGERLQALSEQVKGSASGKVLLSLIRAAGGKGFGAYPPTLAPALESLSTRLGGVLEDFLRAPGDEAFREIRQALTPEEKGVLGILQRVSRAQ